MANIFPINPPAFDRADIAGTVKRTCDYNTEMFEQMDFQLSLIQKDIDLLRQAIEALKPKPIK